MVGSQITLGGRDDLTTQVSCTIKDNKGNRIQVVAIGTSRNDDLFLKDIFGSLQLETCNSLDCLVDVSYYYTIKNGGETDLEIVEVERSREGITDNLVTRLPDTSLRPQEQTDVRETDVIDVCVEAEIITVVTADGEPPCGYLVSDSDTYVVQTHGLPEREVPSKPCVPGKGKGKGGKGKKTDSDYFDIRTEVVPQCFLLRQPRKGWVKEIRIEEGLW
jgi:hypothetical protein